MRCRILCGVVGVLIACGVLCAADRVEVGRTPIVTAVLSNNASYEVQVSSNGGSWSGTGVLAPGAGSAATVRLDGFPAHASYRFARIGSAEVNLATVRDGVHLAAAFAGATEVRMQRSLTLESNSWAHEAFVFPDARGEFAFPVREPTLPHAFFRAVKPATPVDLATLTYYEANPSNTVYAGFELVVDDMPQLYRDGLVVAPCLEFYHRNGIAAAAGECYEFFGTTGRVTTIVADVNPFPAAGTCTGGRNAFDLGARAFDALYSRAVGLETAAYRLVPAPVTGNVKLVAKEWAGGYYVEFRVYNHRAGVAKLEVRSASSSVWTELPRSDYNAFVYSGGAQLTLPLSVRVTSRFGEVVSFPTLSSVAKDQRFAASSQFAVFPELDLVQWHMPPIYSERLTDLPGAQWSASGAIVDTAYSVDVYRGSNSMRVSGLPGFGAFMLTRMNRFPTGTNDVLEFAIKSGSAFAVTGLSVMLDGVDASGVTAVSAQVALPAISNEWRLIRLPLGPARPPKEVSAVRWVNGAGTAVGAVLLDEVIVRR